MLTDSVDADDGLIDGLGRNGHSWFTSSFSITFDANVLGALPTHVGIVGTDTDSAVSFQAFDASGSALPGSLTADFFNGSYAGETNEDRFFGVINPNGISRITLTTNGGLETDHLQYGRFGNTAAAPEPASLALLLPLMGGVSVAAMRRRR